MSVTPLTPGWNIGNFKITRVSSFGGDYIDYDAIQIESGSPAVLREYVSNNLSSRNTETGEITPITGQEEAFEQGRDHFVSSANRRGLQGVMKLMGSSWLVYMAAQPAHPAAAPPPLYTPSTSSHAGTWIFIIMVLVVLGGGAYYFSNKGKPEKKDTVKPESETIKSFVESRQEVRKKDDEEQEPEEKPDNPDQEGEEKNVVSDEEPEEVEDKEEDIPEDEEDTQENEGDSASYDYTIILPPGWPDKVIIQEETARKSTYRLGKSRGLKLRSPHFQITCPVELDEEGVKRVVNRYEGTWQALLALPLEFPKVRAKSSRVFKEELAGNYEEYVRLLGASAPKHAASTSGLYMPEQGKTVAYCSSLGIGKDGSVSPINSPVSAGTITHELTHQLTSEKGQKVWFKEGIATYMGTVPMDDKGFYFDQVVERLQRQKERASNNGKREKIEIPWTLKEFLNLSDEDFQNYRKIGLPLYELSQQLFTFFVHLDGKEGVKALQKYIDTGNPAVLLRKKSWKEMERIYITAWAELGVDVEFNAKRNKAEDQRAIRRMNQENDKAARRNEARKRSQ